MATSRIFENRQILQKPEGKHFDVAARTPLADSGENDCEYQSRNAAAMGDFALVNDLLVARANGKTGWRGYRDLSDHMANRFISISENPNCANMAESSYCGSPGRESQGVVSFAQGRRNARRERLHYNGSVNPAFAAVGGHEAIANFLLLAGAGRAARGRLCGRATTRWQRNFF